MKLFVGVVLAAVQAAMAHPRKFLVCGRNAILAACPIFKNAAPSL